MFISWRRHAIMASHGFSNCASQKNGLAHLYHKNFLYIRRIIYCQAKYFLPRYDSKKKNKLLAPLKELRWRPPTVINQVEDINPTSSLRYKVKYLPLGHRAKKHTARLGSQASLTGVHTHHHRLCCLQHNQCRIPGLQESSKTQNLFHNCLIISKMSTITDNFLENI